MPTIGLDKASSWSFASIKVAVCVAVTETAVDKATKMQQRLVKKKWNREETKKRRSDFIPGIISVWVLRPAWGNWFLRRIFFFLSDPLPVVIDVVCFLYFFFNKRKQRQPTDGLEEGDARTRSSFRAANPSVTLSPYKIKRGVIKPNSSYKTKQLPRSKPQNKTKQKMGQTNNQNVLSVLQSHGFPIRRCTAPKRKTLTFVVLRLS